MAEARTRRQAATRWAALAGLTLLAACQTGPRRRPVTPPPPPPRDQTPPPAVTQGLPTDAERHRVALLVPMSGSNAGVGTSIANAANMAVMDTGGQRIRVTMYDTAGGAGAAASRALAEGNKVILGPLTADEVRQVAPVARAARVPVVAFSNDTSVAGDGVYLLGYAPEQAVQRVVDHARGQGVTGFAGLVPTGVYGQRASASLTQSVRAADGRLTGVQVFDRRPGALLTAAARVGQAGPFEAVLIADTASVAAQAAPVIRRNGGANARLLGTELWNTDSRLASYAALRGAYFASVSDTLYRQLATKYRARFGRSPYRLASLGYDSVLLITKIATVWPVGRPFPERELRDRDGFTGIDGAFRFGGSLIAERALEVQQIGASGPTVVSPAPRGFR